VAELALVRPMTRAIAITLAVTVAGCAADRYRWSLAHEYLSPNARHFLSRGDIEEITRVVSAATPQPVLGIAYLRHGEQAGKVTVVTSFEDGQTSDGNSAFWLRKQEGHWHIVGGGGGLSQSLIGMALSDD
jgi:hypothetical protein